MYEQPKESPKVEPMTTGAKDSITLKLYEKISNAPKTGTHICNLQFLTFK